MSRHSCDGKAFHSRGGRQKKNFCRRSCCVCVEQHIFSQTQIEAEGGQYRQLAECRKLGTTVSVQPTTGEPGTRASTLPFDEQEASATSVRLQWSVMCSVRVSCKSITKIAT